MYTAAHFGAGTGRVWIGDAECTGDELDLSLCKFPGWGKTECSHRIDLGINCGKCY
jgi:hypothetical protein